MCVSTFKIGLEYLDQKFSSNLLFLMCLTQCLTVDVAYIEKNC